MTEKLLKYSDWLKAGEYPELELRNKIFCRHVEGDGPNILLLHGFPTSSYDWAKIIEKLRGQARITAFDFLGFGASEKPHFYPYNFVNQADIAEDVAEKYQIESCILVAHDYGVTVAQELIRRQEAGEGSIKIEKVIFLNGGIYHQLHRPVLMQKILLLPIIGSIVANSMTLPRFHNALNKAFTGEYKLSEEEAAELWHGITKNDGQKIMPKLLSYIAERNKNGDVWENAMEKTAIPLSFIWGLKDPVSGKHLLDFAKQKLSNGKFFELADVAHYPQVEAPDKVAEVILKSL